MAKEKREIVKTSPVKGNAGAELEVREAEMAEKEAELEVREAEMAEKEAAYMAQKKADFESTLNDDEPIPPAKLKEQEDEQMYKLLIHRTESEQDGVDISVNGMNIHVLRGAEVIVRGRYIEALNNAKVETFKKNPANGEETPYSYHRYPHSASQTGESVKDFEERMEAEKKAKA